MLGARLEANERGRLPGVVEIENPGNGGDEEQNNKDPEEILGGPHGEIKVLALHVTVAAQRSGKVSDLRFGVLGLSVRPILDQHLILLVVAHLLLMGGESWMSLIRVRLSLTHSYFLVPISG